MTTDELTNLYTSQVRSSLSKYLRLTREEPQDGFFATDLRRSSYAALLTPAELATMGRGEYAREDMATLAAAIVEREHMVAKAQGER